MFFSVSKLVFDVDTITGSESKDLNSLCEKIQSRFHVIAKPFSKGQDAGTAIAVSTLFGTEKKISEILDDIVELCEESGFGRVDSEHTLLEHVNTIEEFEDEEEN